MFKNITNFLSAVLYLIKFCLNILKEWEVFQKLNLFYKREDDANFFNFLKDDNEAIAFYRDIEDYLDDHSRLNYLQSLYRTNNFYAVIKVSEQITQEIPALYRSYVGNSYYLLGYYNHCIDYYNYINVETISSLERYILGASFAKIKAHEAAIIILSKINKEELVDDSYEIILANSYYYIDVYDKAIKFYKAHLNSLDNDSKFRLGYSLKQVNNIDEALQIFNTVEVPLLTVADKTILGNFYFDNYDYYNASKIYSLCIDSISSLHLINKYAFSFYKANLYQNAILAYNKLIQNRFGDYHDNIDKLSTIFFTVGQYHQAIDTLKKVHNRLARKFHMSSIGLNYIFAESYFRIGKYNKAIEAYNSIKKLDFYQLGILANAYYQIKSYKDAIAILGRVPLTILEIHNTMILIDCHLKLKHYKIADYLYRKIDPSFLNDNDRRLQLANQKNVNELEIELKERIYQLDDQVKIISNNLRKEFNRIKQFLIRKNNSKDLLDNLHTIEQLPYLSRKFKGVLAFVFLNCFEYISDINTLYLDVYEELRNCSIVIANKYFLNSSMVNLNEEDILERLLTYFIILDSIDLLYEKDKLELYNNKEIFEIFIFSLNNLESSKDIPQEIKEFIKNNKLLLSNEEVLSREFNKYRVNANQFKDFLNKNKPFCCCKKITQNNTMKKYFKF